MRRGFGERLGLPGALGPLPLAPLVTEYRELTETQTAAGLRYAGEALTDPQDAADGSAFVSVLDGVALCSPRRRRLLDGAALDALADARPAHAPVLRLLAAIRRRDPALLRRVLLYQLLPLLRQGATGLGLDPAEVRLLTKALPSVPVLDDRQRKAAESLARLWSTRRLRGCDRAVAAVGPGALYADPWLAAFDVRLHRQLDRCDRMLAEAAAGTDPAEAEARYLRVLAVAADDDEAVRGLIRLGTAPDGGDSGLTARPVGGGAVTLSWPDTPGVRWRVLRDGPALDRPDPVRGAVGAGGAVCAAVDTDPPVGLRVRYAAFPVRDGQPTAAPFVSRALLVAPAVEDVTVEDGPARLTVRWRLPRTATGVVVALAGPRAAAGRHTLGRVEQHVFTGLEPGAYTVRLTARHPSPAGGTVDAPEVAGSGTVHAWPRLLTGLTAEPGPAEGVRFAGHGGEGAEVRLVVWPEGAAPAPGTELRTADLPAPLPWARYGDPGFTTPDDAFAGLVSAATVLGERALAGPGVRLDVPGPAGAPRAVREPGGRVRLFFDWPSGAGTVRAAWDGGDLTASRSRYVREGLRLPLGPGPARVTLQPLAPDERPGSAVPVRRAPVAVDVPGEAVVRYRLLTRRRRLGRRAVPYAVEISAHGHDPAVPLPSFVLVHRGGDRASARPRHAEDGTELLRVDGAKLAAAPLQTRALPPAPDLSRPPYALRAFLLGDGAGAVRLEEPALTTLVVR
ncbi:hypothetical protein [Streptomyces sp. NRRL F-5727]|uniref:hypothetical protein n=1 Tax=Streptomyces sp. NRRL F-5727 TaxID=1463871 RepID=UPI0004C64623|nr:hypothetical protein [Streptomyces sp. NRRL F-5727]